MSDVSNDTHPLPPPPPDARPFSPPLDGQSQLPKGSSWFTWLKIFYWSHLHWLGGFRLPGGIFLIPLIAFGGLRWYMSDLPNRHQHQQQTDQVADDSETIAQARRGISTPSSANQGPSYDYLMKRNCQEGESDDGPYNYRVNSRGGNRTSKSQEEPFRYNYDYLLERDGQAEANRKGRPHTYDYDRLMREANEPARPSGAHLKLRWSEATPELLPLLERFTPEQRTVWGVAAVASGFDIYGARVQLINIGDGPVSVSPAKLRVHFGDEAALVFVADDPRFLKTAFLQRGQSVSGLVMFTARADIGASIRSGQGEMSYIDVGIKTEYE